MAIDRMGNYVAMMDSLVAANSGDNTRELAMDMLYNAMATRSDMLKQWMDPRRDINKECGYPDTNSLTPDRYRELYDREPIATRVTEVLPLECWQVSPRITDDEDADDVTEFEQAVEDLSKKLVGSTSYHKQAEGNILWDYLRRVDVMSGIGHFGVLLMGFDDGKNLQDPVDGVITTNTDEGYMTSAEEDALLKLQNLTTNEKAVIDQWALARRQVLNKARKEDRKKRSGWDGIRQGDLPLGTSGTDQQYDKAYGALSPLNPVGSLAGTDQQYFGVQFGPSEQPAENPAKKGLNLLFLRPFDESLVQIVRYEWNIFNPRFGMPVMYRITLNDPREQHSGIGLPMATVFVHWSRVIHVADNLNSSEIFGVPRQRPVMNRLLDLVKLYGGSAEMFWKGAFPGLSFETHPQLGGDVTIDAAALRAQMEQYQNGLQRYLAMMGMTAKTLSPQISDPGTHIDKQIEAICIKIGVPKRVFLGSERGELASSQDDASWNDRLKARQYGYLVPRVIVPFVDRLITVGVLPEPKDGYQVYWPDLDSNTDRDKAQIGLVKTQALAAYTSGNVEAVMPLPDYLRRILGMEKREVNEIVEGAESQAEEDMFTQQPQPEFGASPEEGFPPEEQSAGEQQGEVPPKE